MSDSHDDPIPAPVRAVLELFARELSSLRFGDVDAACLSDLAKRVRETAREVELARGALEAAQEVLAREQAQLAVRAQEALAYARIYATREPELAARLGDLGPSSDAPSGPSAEEPKARRARKKKAPSDAAELPFAPASAA